MYKHVLLFTLIVSMLMGCASQQDLNAVKWEVNSLQTHLDKMERELKNDQASQEKNTQKFLKNQADIASEYTDVRTQMLDLQGKIEEITSFEQTAGAKKDRIKKMETDITAIKQYLGMIDQRKKEPSLYDLGLKSFDEIKYDKAIRLLNAYLKARPQKSLIDNSHFWIGESFFAETK